MKCSIHNFLASILALTATVSKEVHAMIGTPTLVGTSSCQKLTDTKFQIYSAPDGKFSKYDGKSMSLSKLYPAKDKYRALIVGMYHADCQGCVRLAGKLQSLVEELNENLESSSSEMLVGGVVLNADLPLSCAMKPAGPNQCTVFELSREEWQDNLLRDVPDLPIAQDTKELNAWNETFGAANDDLIVYLDGYVYKYVPNPEHAKSMNLKEGEYIEANINSNGGYMNVKQLVLDAYQQYDKVDSYKRHCEDFSIDQHKENEGLSKNKDKKATNKSEETKSDLEFESDTLSQSAPKEKIVHHVLSGFFVAAVFAAIMAVIYWMVKRIVFPHLQKRLHSRATTDKAGRFYAIDQIDNSFDEDDYKSSKKQLEMGYRSKSFTSTQQSSTSSLPDDLEMSMFVNDRREKLNINDMDKEIAKQFHNRENV